MPDLLDAIRTELVSANVVRTPRTAGSEPPMWLQPRNGAPAPGEGNNATERGATAVVSAFLSGGITSQRHEGFIRTDTVDFWLRVTTPQEAVSIESAIRAALNDKRGWTMGGLPMIETLQIRSMQPLGANEQAFSFVTEYSFEVWQ